MKKLYEAYKPNGQGPEFQEHLLGYQVRRVKALETPYRTRLVDLLGKDLERQLRIELRTRSLISFGVAVLQEVVEIKRQQFKQIKSDIENGRVPDLEEQRRLLADAMLLADEIKEIEERLTVGD